MSQILRLRGHNSVLFREDSEKYHKQSKQIVPC